MPQLSVAPRANLDARMAPLAQRYARRVQTCAPGTCPLAVELSLLEAAAAQTCGKCVPCRDGLPHLAQKLRAIVNCDGALGPDTLDDLRSTAAFICDASDCAIGYEAAQAVLDGLTTFADEYASHVEHHCCQPTVSQKVPCEALCPAHVDVPGYLALVRAGDCAGAVNLIRKDNPFPTACAFVCEHPCEERCRRTLIDAPLNIRGIKKYAVDNAPADTVATPPAAPATDRRIAVIGGGPSGLTCAFYLSLMGHSVTVFEMRDQLGGMLRYGIPNYRFPKNRLDEDIRAIVHTGALEVRTGTSIATASEIRSLATDYDAVYVAIGAQTGKVLDLPGIDAEGVVSAVALLGAVGEGMIPCYDGLDVVVIGGGNVAMDCARTAARAGAASVSVVYRRRQEDMTALATEVEAAIAEGVEMLTLEAPVAIEVGEDGCCRAVITQPQMIGPVKRGRPAPLDAAKPRRRIAADVVLVAVGQDVVGAPFAEAGMPVERGCLVTDDHLRVRGFSNVFAGGDCQSGPSTVIRAIGSGKVAARNIDELLGYHHKLPCAVAVPPAAPNDRTPTGRVNIAERPARERKHDFACVETEMSREEALQECGRCLRCDHFGCGVLEGGRVQYV